MNKVIIFIFVVALVVPAMSQKICSFGAPSDSATLRSTNFLQNVASKNCLTLDNSGVSRTTFKQDITLNDCLWDNRPSQYQLFSLTNSNGGYNIQPNSLTTSQNGCVSTEASKKVSAFTSGCSKKDDDQTWIFLKSGKDKYQVVQKSTGKCVQTDSLSRGSTIKVAKCNQDDTQLWRICTSR